VVSRHFDDLDAVLEFDTLEPIAKLGWRDELLGFEG
jgi:hypothetical protein